MVHNNNILVFESCKNEYSYLFQSHGIVFYKTLDVFEKQLLAFIVI